MSTSSRQRPSLLVVEGHEFAGWKTAEALSVDARQKVERTPEAHDFDLEIMRSLDRILDELQGDLVPTCTCG